MKISKVHQELIDLVTPEEKEKLLKSLVADSGSPYKRTILALVLELKAKADTLDKLLHCMGDLTIKQASEEIQKHHPWNGKLLCESTVKALEDSQAQYSRAVQKGTKLAEANGKLVAKLQKIRMVLNTDWY